MGLVTHADNASLNDSPNSFSSVMADTDSNTLIDWKFDNKNTGNHILHFLLSGDNWKHGTTRSVFENRLDRLQKGPAAQMEYILNFPNRQGLTPLHIAALKMYPSVVRLLIRHGADTEQPDVGGRTPLHLLLAAKPEPNLSANDAKRKRESMHQTVRELVDNRREDDEPWRLDVQRRFPQSGNLLDSDGRTVLHLASCNMHVKGDTIEELILKLRPDVHRKDRFKKTAMDYAKESIYANKHDIMGRLLFYNQS